MHKFDTIATLQGYLASEDENVTALIPTMGNLHAGHLSLVETARAAGATLIIVSIYVNPTQFDNKNDFKHYPRSLQHDYEQLEALEVDCVFTPHTNELYPHGPKHHSHIHVPFLTDTLCGATRPGHFDGVATIVMKLFNITQADLAVFGEKDFQQVAVIKKLIADFDIPIEIFTTPTAREADGLAMSSRNQRLSLAQRQRAPQLFSLLNDVADKIQQGDRQFNDLTRFANKQLQQAGFTPDYFSIVDATTLQTAKQQTQDLLIAAAAYLGDVRLIDNLLLRPLP